jgi:hypothetical protein
MRGKGINMKVVMISEGEYTLKSLLQQALQENLILRTADGHEFILAEIENFDHEIELTQQNEQLMRLLDERGQEKATISIADARARLGIE